MKCPKCSHEWNQEDLYFQTCFEYIADRFPLIHTANTSLIHQWKQAGYDFETVVKPAVDSAVKSGKNVGLSYINTIIQASLKNEVKSITPEKIAITIENARKEWFKRMKINHPKYNP